MKKNTENTARYVVSKFGGVKQLAELLDVARSTVYRWQQVGHISQSYQLKVLVLAARLNISLTAEELIIGYNYVKK